MILKHDLHDGVSTGAVHVPEDKAASDGAKHQHLNNTKVNPNVCVMRHNTTGQELEQSAWEKSKACKCHHQASRTSIQTNEAVLKYNTRLLHMSNLTSKMPGADVKLHISIACCVKGSLSTL